MTGRVAVTLWLCGFAVAILLATRASGGAQQLAWLAAFGLAVLFFPGMEHFTSSTGLDARATRILRLTAKKIVAYDLALGVTPRTHMGGHEPVTSPKRTIGPRMTGQRFGHPVEVNVHIDVPDRIRTEGAWGPVQTCDNELVVGPEIVLERLGLGRRDFVRLGDPDFDDALVVTGPPLDAFAWLTPERRARLVATLAEHDGFVRHRRVRSVVMRRPWRVDIEFERTRALTDLGRALYGPASTSEPFEEVDPLAGTVDRALSDPVLGVRAAALDLLIARQLAGRATDGWATQMRRLAGLAVEPGDDAAIVPRDRSDRDEVRAAPVEPDEAVRAAVLLGRSAVLRAWIAHSDAPATRPSSLFGPAEASPADTRRAIALRGLAETTPDDVVAVAIDAIDDTAGPALIAAVLDVFDRQGVEASALGMVALAGRVGPEAAARMLTTVDRATFAHGRPVLKALAEVGPPDAAVAAIERVATHGTRDDVAWLGAIAHGEDRPRPVRRAADRALAEVRERLGGDVQGGALTLVEAGDEGALSVASDREGPPSA